MGLPNIEIVFKALANSAIKRGERGTVALILKDTVPEINPIVITNIKDIPKTLSKDNQEQIELAFIGGIKTPIKVIAYILAEDSAEYKEAQDYLETVKWDYLAIPEIKESEVISISTWIKGLRDNQDLKVKAVLPNCTADHEGIINFATNDIKVKDKTYDAAQYCSRIAGILGGNPLNMSATYQIIREIDDVPHLRKEQFDKAIDEGKLVLMHDGEKVKIARAVNSLVTLIDTKSEEFKKIKIVDIMDVIHGDIKKTVADTYIGKVPNDYDHKCILITSINSYLEELQNEHLLDIGKNKVEIDVETIRLYLKSKGVDVEKMSEQDIKEANTGSEVFLTGKVKPLDAMEDISLKLFL